jgi:murein DD-endopeptidase MepM/ murein hydrolase activator NlpD
VRPVRVVLVLVLVLLVVCGPAVPAWAQEWRWPLPGPPAVSRPFAAPAHRYAAGHRGADLAASPGTAVRAAGDGVVSYAGLVAGRGVVVVVHGPLRTTDEPVSALVDPGSPVSAGEVIGVLQPGHAGCPVQACLHWGLRRGEDYLDPVRLVEPGPVRLLPLTGAAPVASRSLEGAAGAGARGSVPALRSAQERAFEDDEVVLAPSAVQAPPPAASRLTSAGLASTAAASVLGAAVAGAALRRRR